MTLEAGTLDAGGRGRLRGPRLLAAAQAERDVARRVHGGRRALSGARQPASRCWPRSRSCASRSAPARPAAINKWYDADIDRLMARTRRRPTACRADRRRRTRSPSASCSRSSRCMVMGARGQLGGGRAAGADDRLLRLRLHDLAEAPHAAEHRDRRRRRRLPADGRLGRGDRRGQPRLDRPVPDHLLLDAAAFLGAGALSLPGLRAGRRADAAGRRRRARRPASMLVYTLVLLPVSLLPLCARPGRRALRRSPRSRSAAASSATRSGCGAIAPSAPRRRTFRYSIVYLFALFAALIVDKALGFRWARIRMTDADQTAAGAPRTSRSR